MPASHHKSWLAKTGVTKAGVLLNTDAMYAGVGYALIDIQLTMEAFPSCQKRNKNQSKQQKKTQTKTYQNPNLFMECQSKKPVSNCSQLLHIYTYKYIL